MMLRRFLAVLLLVPLCAAAGTVRHTLPNGLTLVVREDHRAPVVTVQLWYAVGSADEQPGKTGLSHALEHMMFKGTKSVPAGGYARRIAALGGRNNAYTSSTETVYYVSAAAHNLPEILKLEADRMANLNFSDRDFANEMKVIREERRERIEDNPTGRLYSELQEKAYAKPANRTDVIGRMADLHKLKAQDLRRWYRRWYAPNNAVLVVAGDVQADRVLAETEKQFGRIPKRPLPARQDIAEPAPKAAQSVITGPTKQPMFALAYRVPHLQKTDDTMPYALDMLTNILDGHSAARFNKNLIRGKQIAMSAGSGYTLLSRQPQLFQIEAMPAAGVSTGSLKAAIEAEIADIAEHGVSEEELAQAKTTEEAAEVYGRDSLSTQAQLIGTLETAGFGYEAEAEIRRRLKAVTPAHIREAARLLLQSPQVFVELRPQPETAKVPAGRKPPAKAKRPARRQPEKPENTP